MQKTPYKLKFKHWWWYLFPKRRKWLKDVNGVMTSPQMQAHIEARMARIMEETTLYGTSIVEYQEDGRMRAVSLTQFVKEHPEITNELR